MLGIGIIDDREEQREEISETFDLAFAKEGSSKKTQKNWELFPSVPLPNLRDYPFWITENKISALIVDQRLKEVPPADYHINYDGHDVVKYLRPRMRNLPIVVVTGYQDDVLKDIRDEVTVIVGKDELGRRGNELTKEILEKAEIYKKDYTKKLARIDELAQQVALGKASSENIEELRGLQTDLQLPFVDIKNENDQWLGRFETAIKKLEASEQEARAFIEKTKKTTDETSGD
jgi:hypothetical protein